MIGSLKGIIEHKQPPGLLLDVNGVGYEVQLPMSSFFRLPECGQSIRLYTHLVVRDDAHLLFGFTHEVERTLFRELIKANGVGPKLAQTILSGMSAEELVGSVEREDISALIKLPGVGRKTAERLVVELKDRLAGWANSVGLERDHQDLLSESAPAPAPSFNRIKQEAIEALEALGYANKQAQKVVKQVATEAMSVELVIRESLRSMM
ncbi:Holliday junction branch migration protein RuvA [Dongshaea marina]|uniref:Holliday junction branch migration protein RuvA n=1 Tax=Dongshaea marina TaxID=2047966 RepID=UPI000D3E8F3B|nr:Holliday junction branch migration protein RuvA [Dongshaea marina]